MIFVLTGLGFEGLGGTPPPKLPMSAPPPPRAQPLLTYSLWKLTLAGKKYYCT